MFLNFCHLAIEFECVIRVNSSVSLHFKACFYLLMSINFTSVTSWDRMNRKKKFEKQRWHIIPTEVQVKYNPSASSPGGDMDCQASHEWGCFDAAGSS